MSEAAQRAVGEVATVAEGDEESADPARAPLVGSGHSPNRPKSSSATSPVAARRPAPSPPPSRAPTGPARSDAASYREFARPERPAADGSSSTAAPRPASPRPEPLGRQPLSERRGSPDVGQPDRRDHRGDPGVGRERATPARARGHAGGEVLGHGLPVDPGITGDRLHASPRANGIAPPGGMLLRNQIFVIPRRYLPVFGVPSLSGKVDGGLRIDRDKALKFTQPSNNQL